MLPALIRQTYQTLAVANASTASPADKLVLTVPTTQSVFPDYIVCLENGKKLKMLKRYLQAAYGMTRQQDRKRWGLPENDPINGTPFPASKTLSSI